jgi:hypothetical protein
MPSVKLSNAQSRALGHIYRITCVEELHCPVVTSFHIHDITPATGSSLIRRNLVYKINVAREICYHLTDEGKVVAITMFGPVEQLQAQRHMNFLCHEERTDRLDVYIKTIEHHLQKLTGHKFIEAVAGYDHPDDNGVLELHRIIVNGFLFIELRGYAPPILRINSPRSLLVEEFEQTSAAAIQIQKWAVNEYTAYEKKMRKELAPEEN